MRKLDGYFQYLKPDLPGRDFHAYSIPDFLAEQALGNGCGNGHFPGFQIAFCLRYNMVFHDSLAGCIFDLYTVQDLNLAGIDL